jgi:hypothetical protein
MKKAGHQVRPLGRGSEVTGAIQDIRFVESNEGQWLGPMRGQEMSSTTTMEEFGNFRGRLKI